MEALGLNEIRERYLSFFESKGHLRLKSFSLVPHNDKSLLLINSGMAPMKSYFTGDEIPPRKRVTTCQKCIRTPDIDNVGKTARHGTFFEMMGNFSFGDYFKPEVIPWAWEFITKNLKIDPEKIYVTIYLDDEQAHDLWRSVGVKEDHIKRLGKEDNFWEHGTGPCGPCSEIFYDRGEKYGCGKPTCGPGCDCDRYVEFWNLVFTQFDRDENGDYQPLDHPNIDTGMGLERMATIMQGVDNIFEVDTIRHILDYICNLCGEHYGDDEQKDVSIRVITDHIRSVTFMIGDGIMPSNEGRGYVLRRILRRAARHGRLLGIDGAFLYDVAKEVIAVSGDAYPELREKQETIQKVIKIEEERFDATIDQGLNQLNAMMREMKEKDPDNHIFSGEEAFKLYDTFGFPFDLTKEIVEEQGYTIPKEEFDDAMNAQRERARTARAQNDTAVWADDPFNPLGPDAVDTFVGYQKLKSDAEIIGLIVNDELVQEAHQGDDVLVLLDQTPFYAQSGGQVGDTGRLESEDGSSLIEVNDCRYGSLKRHIHYGKVVEGDFHVGQTIYAHVDEMKRYATARNHTSTHMLQKALKMVLGDHVEQAGSFVSPTRLRFDFNHFQPMTAEEIKQVEEIVNQAILKAMPVETFETEIDKAKEMGAMALFGEKYGHIVRVVKVGDYSIELCGGTHLQNSAQAGMFKIISENGVAAGIRRIEATTGMNTYRWAEKVESVNAKASAMVKAAPDQLIDRIQEMEDQLKEKDREIASLKHQQADSEAGELLNKIQTIQGVKVLIAEVKAEDVNEMRDLSDMMKDRMESGIVVFGKADTDKANLIATATKDIVKKGFHAGQLIKQIAKTVGGGGGGRPDMAQAGGKKPAALDQALAQAENIIAEQLSE
ncbi:alanine--tRNA ligase [uncultured Pseudoramibacter sp.]|uniref:Alanine--tRNA ligase n=1 Tax=Candidatus Pseudoramibacter fermentans TaxID=2594427 RepID=A0A6L5GR63_9FIRM|nr:alanine--tRNA ligase [uncultured Pseudoramibacter sp.]MQM72739.1 alanine--tRNA ligase [Candidatus Pseudoramibacter fermentans]RRF93902.1 MAG: alanine--tRNA ligase [Eubacteriaceae bacterium]